MGFRINTNVAALSAHANSLANNRAIDSSLNKLNSGFRINSAADDASGMAIADSLRSQASSLGKAIMNANDAIGIVQTADKAMDEQIKILDTIKEKAIQSAQDGQTTETRKALQADISRLMEELDNIGNTTSFNGQKLLSGTFSNKEFQIGAYSNETVKASIGPTTSDKIGLTRFETGHNVRASDLTSTANLTFKNVDGINDITFEPVKLTDDSGNIKAGMGLGALVEAINKGSDKTGIKASVTVQSVFEQPIKAGSTTAGFSINGVMIGAIDVKEKDGNGALRSAINSVKDQTGVEASVDSKGRLVLANRDGRGIKVEDNISMKKPATDKHDLVTTTDGGGTVKKGVDFNLGATWTAAADQPGSILNSSNSFADIKMAHGTQDAVIYKNGLDAAKEAKVYKEEPKPDAVSIAKEAADFFAQEEKKAFNELKVAMKGALNTFITSVTGGTEGTETQRDVAAAWAQGLIDTIDEPTSSAKDIIDAYTKFAGNDSVVSQTNSLDVLQGATGSFKTAIEKYEKALTDNVDKVIKEKLAGADVSDGDGKILVDSLGQLNQDLQTPAANSSASELAGLMTKVQTYFDATKDIQGSISEVPKAAVDKFNNIEKTELNKLKDAMKEAITDFKNAAIEDNTTQAGIQNKASANQAADDLLKVLENKDSKIEDIATAYGTFLDNAGVQTQTTALGEVNKANGKIHNAMSAYEDALKTAATNTIKNDLKGADITKGEGDIVLKAADTLAGELDTANKAADAQKATFEALAKKITDYKTSTATIGEGLAPDQVPSADKDSEVFLSNLEFAKNGALNLEAGAKLTNVNKAFEELKGQTTISGANASIDKLNGLLDTVINNAKGKTMDTEEAQQGIYAHAMKQFLAGLKQGLNEPNKEGLAGIIGLNVDNSHNFGRLSLVSTNGRDIQVEVRDANGFTTNSTVGYDKNVAEKTVSLRETNSTIDRDLADAMGHNSEDWQATDRGDNINGYPAGVMTLKGAQAMMNIAEAAAKALQAVRSDLGSVQNQLVATVNNISVTQVNVKAAESNIRDVDFAQESATFSKHQILAQSGVYAMSQANAVQQNVMRLLQ